MARNRQQTASTQSEQPQLPKHVFPIDRKKPKPLTNQTRPIYPIFKNQKRQAKQTRRQINLVG
jgi:hypothetical protein